MSSSGAGVQAHIKKRAPDSEFQGCCLHSLNFVICHSSQIQAVRNMMASCQQVFLFFHNSPKRQRFIEHIINHLCPSASRTTISGLCKTRCVERHNTFTTILELYLYIVKTWDQICYSSDDDEIYPEGNSWKWDSESRSSANGLRHTFTSLEHIVVFFLAKELLEPIRPIAECIQGRLQEVYFGFRKISEVTQHYTKIKENVDVEHNRIYHKAVILSQQIGSEERMPRIIRGRQTRANPSVTSSCDYWCVTVTIPHLNSILRKLKTRFADDKTSTL